MSKLSPAASAERTTISAVSEQIRSRQISCADVLSRCLRKIDEYEEFVRAWVLVDRDAAMQQARRMDQELASGRWRGPLHGIPIGIKDIVDLAGMVTGAGSPLLSDNRATADATIVTRLRDAGAVI